MMQHPQVEAFCGDEATIHVVGHRGARGVMPENSLAGFAYALANGVQLLEFDVVLSRDDVPVITHDHSLHGSIVRAADGSFLAGIAPKVASLNMHDLQGYDIGRLDKASEYGRQFPDQQELAGERIPALADLLQLVSQPDHATAMLMLEIKSDPDLVADPGAGGRIVGRVMDQLRATSMENRTLLHSFDWRLLAECRRLAPHMPLSFLTQIEDDPDDGGVDLMAGITPDFSAGDRPIPERVKAAGGSLWCPYFRDLNADDLALARRLGLCVAVWTVNEAADIDAMIDLHVDAIVTDFPERVQKRLADRGFRWRR